MNDKPFDPQEDASGARISFLSRIRGLFRRKAFIIPGSALLCIAGFLIIYPFFITGKDSIQSGGKKGFYISASALKVMSLNIAHGRGRGLHQLRQKKADFKVNLGRIAELIKREGPAVIAFQEADGPSFWSGDFNHVEYLAQKTEYPYFCRGEHVKGFGLSYGTAVISGIKLRDAVSMTFSPSALTPPKGFVVCTVEYPSKRDAEIDIVSVHLDYGRSSVRKNQVRELITHLSKRKKPLVVMGDFNCEYNDREKTLRTLVQELNLKAYSPDSEDLATFPRFGKRLDWILISQGLEFTDYRVLPDTVSDHSSIIAEIVLKK